jgi:hypothetical protein
MFSGEHVRAAHCAELHGSGVHPFRAICLTFSYLFMFSGEHVLAAQLHGSGSALFLRNRLNF